MCQLLEKCYQSNLRTIVKAGSQDMQESINNTLWTFAQKAFIPHGSALDPYPELQPIYITTGSEHPNNSSVLMLIGTLDGLYEDFQRVLVILDGANESTIVEAKIAYNKLKTASNEVKFYVQTDKAGWKQEL